MDVLILRRTQWFSVVWPLKEAVVNKSWEKKKKKKRQKSSLNCCEIKYISTAYYLFVNEYMYLLLLSATCYLNTAVVVVGCNWNLKVIIIQYHLLNTKLLLHKNSWNQGEMFIKLLTNCFSMVTLCHVSQTTVTKITQEHKFDNCHLVVLIDN